MPVLSTAEVCYFFRRALEFYENEIHHGRIHSNLDMVVNRGLISKDEIDKRANYYRLTDRGEREIEARREWEAEYVPLE